MQQIRDDSGRELFYYIPSYISNTPLKSKRNWKLIKAALKGVAIMWGLVFGAVLLVLCLASFPATSLVCFMILLITILGILMGIKTFYDGS